MVTELQRRQKTRPKSRSLHKVRSERERETNGSVIIELVDVERGKKKKQQKRKKQVSFRKMEREKEREDRLLCV